MTGFHRPPLAALMAKANGTTGAVVEPAAPYLGAYVILLLSWGIYFDPVQTITMLLQF
jgi:hypothetical protein